MEGESLTDTLDEVEFLIEIDGTDFKFHTSESLGQLFFHALEHLIIVSHPHKAIDRDAYLTTTERGIEKQVTMLEVKPSSLQSKEHRGIGAHSLIVDGA